MNKQEAIKIIEQSTIKIANRERVIFKAGETVAETEWVDHVPLDVVVNTINQIHEPQKVVVPKFVAEWLEDMKNAKIEFFEAQSNCMSDEVADWYYNHADDLLRAWLDGFEVEQERLYTVEIPNPNNRFSKIFLIKEKGEVRIGAGTSFGKVPDDKWKKDPNTHLTEAEIKQDFEWAWDAGFAKEVE